MFTLTKEQRDAITPKEAVNILKKGNQRFVENLKIDRHHLTQVNETSEGQHPLAFILSCIDSRTSAELIFDQGLGDVFSCRIAGNILNDDIIGSMEFACKVVGVKVIAVIGHSKCGAINGACDDVKLGNLTTLLDKVKPAIAAETQTKENRTSSNQEFVENVTKLNVELALDEILKRSEIIKEMYENKEIDIVGGMYDVATGVVDFY